MQDSTCPVCGERMTFRLGGWECLQCADQLAATKARLQFEENSRKAFESTIPKAKPAAHDADSWWFKFLPYEKACWLLIFGGNWVYDNLAYSTFSMVSIFVLIADFSHAKHVVTVWTVWGLMLVIPLLLAIVGVIWRRAFVKWGCSIIALLIISFLLYLTVRVHSQIPLDAAGIVRACAAPTFFLWLISILIRDILVIRNTN